MVRAAGGGPAGEEAEAGAVSHAAPGGAAPAADGRSQPLAGRGLPGPGPSEQAETSPEPFRPQGNAGLPAMKVRSLQLKDILSELL